MGLDTSLGVRPHWPYNVSEAVSLLKAIKETIEKAQARFTDLQWEMQPQVEKLAQILKTHPTDEAAALAQLDRVVG